MKKKWIIAIVAIVAVLLLAGYGASVLASKKKVGPRITNIYTDPVEAKPGDEMLISANIKDKDKVGIKSVQAFIFYKEWNELERYVDVLDLNLVSGNTWQAVWDVRNILQGRYTIIIRAENEAGIVSEKDPYGNDYFVILNSGTNLNCNNFCKSSGYDSCTSIGIDDGGTDNGFYNNECNIAVDGNCTHVMYFYEDEEDGQMFCSGNVAYWTNCLCKNFQS